MGSFGPVIGPAIPEEEPPGWMELGGALWRRETMTFDFIKNSVAKDNLVTDEEFDLNMKAGFSRSGLVSEIEGRSNAPDWITEPEARLKLLSTRSPLQFEQVYGQLSDEYRDRELIERAPWYATLPLSLGVGVLDAPAMLLGGIGGALVRKGTVTMSLKAKKQAGYTYKELMAERASSARYLTQKNVNPTAPSAVKARATVAKRIDDIDEAAAGFRRSAIGAGITEAAVSAAGVEVTLSDQVGRTGEEVAMNIVGSIALSGLLSGSAAAFGGMFKHATGGISDFQLQRARDGLDGVMYAPDSVNPLGGSTTTRPKPGDAVPPVDNSPVFFGDEVGVLPHQDDLNLRREYGMPDSGDVSKMTNYAEYIQARAAKAKEYTGIKATVPMRFLRALHPALRMKTSELSSVRDIAGALIDADFVEAGAHINGKPTVRNVQTVENKIRLDEADTQLQLNLIFNRGMEVVMKKGEEAGSAFSRPSAWNEWKRKNLMGRSSMFAALQEEVTKFIYAPGVYKASGPFKGMDAEIKGIADDLNKNIFGKWEDLQIRMAMIKTHKITGEAIIPEGMYFYMNRKWDIDKINANPNKLRKTLYDFYLKNAIAEEVRLMQGRHRDAKSAAPEPTQIDDVELMAKIDKSAKQAVSDFIEGVRGNPLHLATAEIAGGAIPDSLKARLPIPSEQVLGFLDMNLGKNMGSWIKSIAPEARLREALGGNGYEKRLNDLIANERDVRVESLNTLLKQDPKNKKLVKEIKRVKRAAEKDANDITNTIKSLRNEYGIPEDPDAWYLTAGKVLRAWNFVTKLGGMTISSGVDPAYLMSKAGLGAAIKALGHGLGGWPSMKRGYNKLESEYRSRGTKEFKEFRQDAHMLGIVSELVTNSRVDQYAMIADPTDIGTKWDDAVAKGTGVFSKLTLMSRYNDWIKSVSHMAYTFRIERALKENDLRYLADMGIDETSAKTIKKLWGMKGERQQGATPDGTEVDFVAPNIRAWHETGDPAAAAAQDLMRSVMRRAVDSTIVGPGVGDIPFVMRRPLGKIIGQFQTFPLAIMSRVVIPSVQRVMNKGDPLSQRLAALGVLAIMPTIFGLAVNTLKVAFREGPNTMEALEDYGPDRALMESIERSGMFGPYQQALNFADDISGNQISKAFADMTPWGEDGENLEVGYVSQTPWIDQLSVSVSTINDIGTFVAGIERAWANGDDMSWGTGSAARRLTPANNLFYTHYINKLIQEQIPFIREPTKK